MKRERLNQKFLDEFKEYDFSPIKELKIFLVGSNTKAKDYFIKIESILQIKYKKLVSICSIDGLLHKKEFSFEEWEVLQETGLAKLNDQESILVLDVENYIGRHTQEEIDYFGNELKKPIYYLSKLREIEK